MATLGFPRGELRLIGRVDPEQIVVDESQLAMGESRLQIRGTIGTTGDRVSAVRVAGAIDVAELAELPLLSTPALLAWRPQGVAEVDAQLRGSWSDLATLSGQARVRAAHLVVKDVPIDELTGRVEFERGILRCQIPCMLLAGGKTWSEFTLTPTANGARQFLLEADIVGLQLETLTRAIPAWRTRAIAGNASSHFILSGIVADRATWKGQGWLNASGQHLGEVPLLESFFTGGLFVPLADALGLEVLRRAEITQASLHWQLAQQQIATDDARIAGIVAGAAIVIYGRGRIGLDRSLDLDITPELSEQIITQSRVLGGASGLLAAPGVVEQALTVIHYRLTGTLQHPVPHFQIASPGELLKSLLGLKGIRSP